MIVKAFGQEETAGAIEVITPFEATDVSPTTVNINGGDLLTVTGRGFPTD